MAVRRRMPSWAIPSGLATDAAGNVYIADPTNMRIRRVTPDGIISTIAGVTKDGYSGDGGPALEAQMWSPHGVAVDASGNVYIADTENDVIRQLTPASPAIAGVTNAAGYQPQDFSRGAGFGFWNRLEQRNLHSPQPLTRPAWAHPAWVETG
jgi:hypothetical protein